jgi:hypothetical protein
MHSEPVVCWEKGTVLKKGWFSAWVRCTKNGGFRNDRRRKPAKGVRDIV